MTESKKMTRFTRTWLRLQAACKNSSLDYMWFRRCYCMLRTARLHTKSIVLSSETLPREINSECEEPYRIDEWERKFFPQKRQFDWKKLCDPQNTASMRNYLAHRKGAGCIDKVIALKHSHDIECDEENKKLIMKELTDEASKLCNVSHSDSPIGDESCAEVLGVYGEKREFNFKPRSHEVLGESLGLLRTHNVNLTTGHRTYYFIGDLARLEQALVQYSINKLLKNNFIPMSVPEVIYPEIIEGCGFSTQSADVCQVYKIPTDQGPSCLIGTAEMPLAGFFSGKIIDVSQLPITVIAASRCYRAETSSLLEERGIYRVHQFTKVEMFGITSNHTGEESDKLLKKFVEIQKEMFLELGLCFRIMNMPSEELGKPAFQKIDMEAWMPDKMFWGEISSSSSCTDFQSRNLNIKYRNNVGEIDFPHTVNGTAVAIPRMIMALLENYQQEDGSVILPEVLWPYMNGIKSLRKDKNDKTEGFKWIKAVKLK